MAKLPVLAILLTLSIVLCVNVEDHDNTALAEVGCETNPGMQNDDFCSQNGEAGMRQHAANVTETTTKSACLRRLQAWRSSCPEYSRYQQAADHYQNVQNGIDGGFGSLHRHFEETEAAFKVGCNVKC